jgi:hypothetical protein
MLLWTLLKWKQYCFNLLPDVGNFPQGKIVQLSSANLQPQMLQNLKERVGL